MNTKESIEVVAAFNKSGHPQPTIFKYGQKVYRVQKINLFHSIKQGASRILIYNIVSEGNNWVLSFNNDNLRWTLQDQYSFSQT